MERTAGKPPSPVAMAPPATPTLPARKGTGVDDARTLTGLLDGQRRKGKAGQVGEGIR